jgi:primosomal protein N' (replication factor Y)
VDKRGLDLKLPKVVRVAVNAPLRKLFDYLPPPAGPSPVEGARIRVPFGRSGKIGLIVEAEADSSLPAARLRRADQVLDAQPVIDGTLLRLLVWSADYYGHPIGEVCAAALPGLLRKGKASDAVETVYRATAEGLALDPAELARRAPRQAELLEILRRGPAGAGDPELKGLPAGWRDAFRRLAERGLAEICARAVSDERRPGSPARPGPALTEDQRAAVAAIRAALTGYRGILLHGATGSGKTEVYLSVIESVVQAGRQALVLVPEIGLTPQLVDRFSERFEFPPAVLHSAMSDAERLAAWRHARHGVAPVIIGTRSAVFAPLRDCGLIIVDEEHDPSLKQQDGFRYSARDLAVVRARMSGVPVILGSATPSLETMQNARSGRYLNLLLPERPGAARHPELRVIDLRRVPSRDGLSPPLLAAMERHLEADGQVMLFLNRRGYAPVLFCTECGWLAECGRCDARMTLHQRSSRLRCHHCGRESPPPERCPDCRCELKPLGEGTERIEETLHRFFPGSRVARIDRDATRNRGSLDTILADMRSGRTRILVGTQMLTKGHDFPGVTLVGVLNADQGLFGTDFRSDERLAQTILQVAGRAGRADRAGEVLIQTSYPEHPLLQDLINQGYDAFAEAALAQRQASGWPPFSYLALLRAEAHQPGGALSFLQTCRDWGEPLAIPGVRLLGPAPAPMERRSGRYRAQLLLQAGHRRTLHALLERLLPLIEQSKQARQVRWSLDVDPVELF